ncbi:MAG TPA: hypothetical protein VJ913_05725 [Actinomycetota bacterium]|nr:hypothetical protein [Actinomycetota bacterium]
MLRRFAANIRACFSAISRLTAAKVAVGTIVAACLVTPQGWRLLVAIAALGLLFAAVGAYLGIDLEAEETKEESAHAFADLS